MAFWLFKRKRDEEAHKKIEKVHEIIRNSFSNVKKDVSELGQWYKGLENKHKNNEYKFEEFEKRLKRLERELDYFLDIKTPETKEKEIKNEFKEANLVNNQLLSDTLNSLTTTHKKIFLTLFNLQKQLGTNKVSYKSLGHVLYSNKSYAEVRSTLSQYLSFLEDHGLVEKIRKGKESFVGLTDPGFDVIESLNKEKDEIIKQPKRIRNT